jgi:hypothetical protein
MQGVASGTGCVKRPEHETVRTVADCGHVPVAAPAAAPCDDRCSPNWRVLSGPLHHAKAATEWGATPHTLRLGRNELVDDVDQP